MLQDVGLSARGRGRPDRARRARERLGRVRSRKLPESHALPQPSADHFSSARAGVRRGAPDLSAGAVRPTWRAARPRARRAWDCAAGNGQATLALAERFDDVTATDASAAQLAQAPRASAASPTARLAPRRAGCRRLGGSGHGRAGAPLARPARVLRRGAAGARARTASSPSGATAFSGWTTTAVDGGFGSVLRLGGRAVLGARARAGRDRLPHGAVPLRRARRAHVRHGARVDAARAARLPAHLVRHRRVRQGARLRSGERARGRSSAPRGAPTTPPAVRWPLSLRIGRSRRPG